MRIIERSKLTFPIARYVVTEEVLESIFRNLPEIFVVIHISNEAIAQRLNNNQILENLSIFGLFIEAML